MFSLSLQRETNNRREAENSSRLLTVRNMTALFFEEREEFRTRARVFLERAKEARRFHDRVLFFNAAHHRAKMFCLHDHANAERLQAFHQRVGNLNRELLLDLKSPRENIDNARDLRKSDHFSVRNISDVRPADERKQMMLAHRVELDVFDENDLARFRTEDRAVNNL